MGKRGRKRVVNQEGGILQIVGGQVAIDIRSEEGKTGVEETALSEHGVCRDVAKVIRPFRVYITLPYLPLSCGL